MKCGEFQKRFETDVDLSSAAKRHLENCRGCRNFQRAEARLGELLQKLPKVAAPKDFAVRVNSAIAETEKIKRPLPIVWQTARLSVPVGAAVLILGFIFFNSNLFSSEETAALPAQSEPKTAHKESKIQEKQTEPAAAAEIPALDSEIEKKSEITRKNTEKIGAPENAASEKNPAAKKSPFDQSPAAAERNAPAKSVSNAVDADFPRSEKFASTEPEVLLPRDSREARERKSSTASKNEALRRFGISLARETWTIEKIERESRAEKSGVQPGDVVLEINDEPVTKIVSEKDFSVKTLKISRNGKILKIDPAN